MNFAQEKAMQNLEDLFYLLIGKSGQIFAFSQIFLTVEYLEEYQIFHKFQTSKETVCRMFCYSVREQMWTFFSFVVLPNS